MNQDRKYLILGTSLVVILVIGFIVNGNNASSTKSSPSHDTLADDILGPVFKLTDLRGMEHRLTDKKGAPVLVHFMSVSCGGEYTKMNDNQLKQLKSICTDLCEEEKLSIFTVIVSTCETTDLSLLYDMYNITWVLGNDYQDNVLDVVETYREYEPEDGMVILLDKNLLVNEVIKTSISADSVIEKIVQLEG